MPNRFLVILSGILALCVVYLFKRNMTLKQRCQKSLATIKRMERTHRIYDAKICQLTEIITMDFSALGNITVKDTSDKAFKLADLVTDGTKLIYRFSGFTSDSSYTSQFEKLKVLANKIGDSRVVLLFSLPEKAKLSALYEKFNLRFPAFKVDSADMGNIAIERYHLPYLFVLDAHLQARFTYFPDKMIPDLSNLYFERISNQFL